MHRYLFSSILALALTFAAHGQVAFETGKYQPIEIAPQSSSGLDKVYVVWSASDTKISYKASSSSVTWEHFSNLGGGFAETLTPTQSGNTYTIPAEGDMGYIITDGNKRTYFWVVDYSNHYLQLNSLTPAAEQECDVVTLSFSGSADRITYYTINGAQCTLSRELTLTFNNLVFDSDQNVYNQQQETKTLTAAGETIRVSNVWCNTQFTLSGDRFLSAWGLSQSIETDVITTTSVSAETYAVVEERDVENEQTSETSSTAVGGSGPVEATFTAIVTDAAIYTEWQIATDEDFESIEDRYLQTEFSYTFRETGTRYVRFTCADASGLCTYTSGAYEIEIGESTLLCPNAFSPLNDDGVNDEWRVSYKSIIDFDCHIFNRWGKELAHLTDPSQGWDGTYGGKKVPAGVYFYVIKATGSDSKQYNLSGHINIVGQSSSSSLSSDTSDTSSSETTE